MCGTKIQENQKIQDTFPKVFHLFPGYLSIVMLLHQEVYLEMRLKVTG